MKEPASSYRSRMTIQIRGTNLFFTSTKDILQYMRDNSLILEGMELSENGIIIDVDNK